MTITNGFLLRYMIEVRSYFPISIVYTLIPSRALNVFLGGGMAPNP